MLSKLKSGLKAIVAFVKAHPVAFLVTMLVGGMFIVPFVFFAWNKLRGFLPASVQRVTPVAEAKVTPGA